MGLQWAGFEVFGIDIKKHLNYPGHFIQGDALSPPVNLSDFDLVWTSPPYQKFSMSTNSAGIHAREKHPNLIPEIRTLLQAHPFTVIENVPQAPIRQDLLLYGVQFGLEKLWRKRAFELSFYCTQIPTPKQKPGTYYTIAGTLGCNGHFYRRKKLGKPGSLSKNEGKLTMGIPMCHQMTRKEISESVSPFMSHYIAAHAAMLIKGETQPKLSLGKIYETYTSTETQFRTKAEKDGYSIRL